MALLRVTNASSVCLYAPEDYRAQQSLYTALTR